jgi:hypothetical protein
VTGCCCKWPWANPAEKRGLSYLNCTRVKVLQGLLRVTLLVFISEQDSIRAAEEWGIKTQQKMQVHVHLLLSRPTLECGTRRRPEIKVAQPYGQSLFAALGRNP